MLSTKRGLLSVDQHDSSSIHCRSMMRRHFAKASAGSFSSKQEEPLATKTSDPHWRGTNAPAILQPHRHRFFAILALAHLIRVALALPIQIGAMPVPLWVSWIGLIVADALSV